MANTEGLAAQLDQASRAHVEGMQLVTNYGDLARKIVLILQRLREIEAQRQAAAAAAKAAGESWGERPVEADACAAPDGGFRLIADAVQLPHPENSTQQLWPGGG